MKKFSETELRIAQLLEQMQKAMPEVKRQIAVYEKNKRNGTLVKNPQPAPQFRNV